MVRDLLALLDRTREVDIETRSAAGKAHRVIIWVVVVDGTVYVASYRGKTGRWWRELAARGEGVLIVGRRRIPVRARRVRSEATRAAFSEAVGTKYRSSRSSMRAMQQHEVLETLLRLEFVKAQGSPKSKASPQAAHDLRMRALDDFLGAYEAEHGVITTQEIRDATKRTRGRAIVVRSSLTKPGRAGRGVA